MIIIIYDDLLSTCRRVLAAMTTPGVQKPHWLPLCLTKEDWRLKNISERNIWIQIRVLIQMQIYSKQSPV